jgi:hypothetical protein
MGKMWVKMSACSLEVLMVYWMDLQLVMHL